MTAASAGVVMYRRTRDGLEVLLVHPGGPFWRNKDDGAWSIPKGEIGPGETPEAVARREFAEEQGHPLVGKLMPLGEVRQKSGKHVTAFAIEGDLDVATSRSNSFTLEWPPKSGKMQSFPEVDRAEWFGPDAARAKLNPGQVGLIDRLAELLEERDGGAKPRGA
jgi:predicted NUDIX family NTP pyrophosphohydrolase